MASSLPIIATKVGSIPDFLEDREHALLVPPKQPEALAEAVAALSLDGSLRRKLIAEGMALARGNTLERRADELVGELGRWIEGEKQ